jgi:DNA-binding HxlR family transcriptional regulator
VILCLLTKGAKRTSELKKSMPKITQKMLTQQLRELEKDGIIQRMVYQQIPPKVEYSLTEYGKTLTKVLDMMCSWGEAHIEKKAKEKATL